MQRLSLEAFTGMALNAADDVMAGAVKRAAKALAERHAERGVFDTDVAECLAYARQLQDVNTEAVPLPRRVMPDTPGSRALATRLRDQLATWAEQVRRDVFGSGDAPFRSWADAIEWLEAQEREERRTHPHANPYRKTLLPDVADGVTVKQQFYIGDGSTSAIARLKAAVASTATATGVREFALLRHVLLPNASPTLPVARLALHRFVRVDDGAVDVERTEATITLLVRDVTLAQLRRLYAELRKTWTPTDRGLSKNDVRILAVVERVEAERQAGKRRETKWVRVARLAKYPSGEYARCAYNRAKKKIRSRAARR